MDNININEKMPDASILLNRTILFTNAQKRVPNEKSTKEPQFNTPTTETTMSG